MEQRELGFVTNLDFQSANEIPVTGKTMSLDPIIIACVHCQGGVSNHRHEDDELVPGAPTDRPPGYSAAVKDRPFQLLYTE
jgi:hypothetical protein